MFMKNKILYCVFISLIVFSLFGCSKENTSKYVSITNTYEENNNLKTDILLYDFQSNNSRKIKSVPYTSQYPLALYNIKNDAIYYTALSKDKKGDELFVLNCKTDECSQLTNTFFAINNIFDLGDRLFIAGVKRGGDSLVKPYLYNKDDQTIKELLVTDDFNICCASYNTETNDLLIAGYLSQDEEAAFDNQDENGDSKGIDNYIFKLYGETFKMVYLKKNCYIKSIVSNQDNILIKWGSTYFDNNEKLSVIKDNKEKSFSISKNEAKRMSDDSLVYYNSNDLYYINSTDRKGKEKYDLCCFSMKNKRSTVIYHARNNSAINNAQFIK